MNSKVLNKPFGAYHLHEKECNNSMDWAQSIAFDVPHGTLCTADVHKIVRGRHDRRWRQHSGQLLLTYIAEKPKNSSLEHIVMAISIALYDAIAKYAPDVYIKWPNDIFYNDKKVGGILTKTVTRDNITKIIIGMGINIDEETIPKDVTSIGTSVSHASQSNICKQELTQKIHNSFNYYYNDLLQKSPNDLGRKWVSACKKNKHKKAQVFHLNTGKNITGIISDYTENGSIIVQDVEGLDSIKLSFIDVISILDK